MNRNEYVAQHFPEVKPSARPCGNQILVQLRTVKKTSSGGIILAQATTDFNQGNTQIGRLVSKGQIAFKDRSSGEVWKEGAWAEIGDVVVVPKWGGFRFEVPVPGTNDVAVFAIFEDFNVKMVVEDNFEVFDKLL